MRGLEKPSAYGAASVMAIDRQDMNRRLIKLAEGPNVRFWRIGYDQLAFAERVFGLIWELESEVNNGGFHQYFCNSTGRLAPDVAAALHAVGAARTAALVQQALAAAGDVPWSDDDARKAAITGLAPAVREKLNELDQAFYAGSDDLTELLYRYVDKHRAEIGAPESF
jgi:hypothetical protein